MEAYTFLNKWDSQGALNYMPKCASNLHITKSVLTLK